jgi:hypothetical protein
MPLSFPARELLLRASRRVPGRTRHGHRIHNPMMRDLEFVNIKTVFLA